MKLIVSTFLVYKVKKCLLKSGKVKEKHHKYLPVATGKHAHKYEETCP